MTVVNNVALQGAVSLSTMRELTLGGVRVIKGFTMYTKDSEARTVVQMPITVIDPAIVATLKDHAGNGRHLLQLSGSLTTEFWTDKTTKQIKSQPMLTVTDAKVVTEQSEIDHLAKRVYDAESKTFSITPSA